MDLKQDKDRVILTMHKGVALVVLTDRNTSEKPWTFLGIGIPTDL